MWPAAFEHRFAAGELAGHALGNLVLVGLAETLGDSARRSTRPAGSLGAVGRVLPATSEPSCSRPTSTGEAVEGQVAVQNAAAADPPGRRSFPPTPRASRGALDGDRRPPTRSSSPPARSTRACSRCSASPTSRPRSPRQPGRVVQVANLRAADPRDRRASTPPTTSGRCSSTASGSTFRWSTSTAALAGRRGRGPGARRRRRSRPMSPDPTGAPTIRPNWRRHSQLCCSPERPSGQSAQSRVTRIERRRDGGVMTVRVGINGFGRIGRSFTRALLARGARGRGRAGRGERPVRRRPHDGVPAQARLRRRHAPERGQGRPTTASRSTATRSRSSRSASPAEIPWGDNGVDVVIESTGLFTARERRRRAPRRAAPSAWSSRRRAATPTP